MSLPPSIPLITTIDRKEKKLDFFFILSKSSFTFFCPENQNSEIGADLMADLPVMSYDHVTAGSDLDHRIHFIPTGPKVVSPEDFPGSLRRTCARSNERKVSRGMPVQGRIWCARHDGTDIEMMAASPAGSIHTPDKQKSAISLFQSASDLSTPGVSRSLMFSCSGVLESAESRGEREQFRSARRIKAVDTSPFLRTL